MNQLLSNGIPFYLSFAAGCVVMLVLIALSKRSAKTTLADASQEATRVLRDAQRDADSKSKEIILGAKEEAHQLLQNSNENIRQKQDAATQLENSLATQNRNLADRQAKIKTIEEELKSREVALSKSEATMNDQSAKYKALVADQERELQRVSGMTADEAKTVLIEKYEGDARRESANLLKRLEHEARETAADKAKQIVTQAIQRSAAEHAIETTVSVVDLPSDDLKGRIIGREGRNIRALETATGVEVIVDDTPGAIILSSFDPYRRAVAKQVIEQLISDGRIHPARIEEVVDKVRSEIDEATLKDGEAAGFELGLHDMHPEIYRMMGKLKFRTSYGQNVLAHSKEVAYLAGVMAREVGLDTHVSIRAAFVHDIGKAMDRELEGTHLELGIKFLKQHGESEAVVDAMAAHHMDIDWPSLESMLVQAADAISAARPGARRDILESYVKRLEKLEEIADSFTGVNKAFALQAGREIRIMVESEEITDEESVWLSKDIAKRIENELEYPGQIKVTVIRETRSIDYAR